MIPERPLTQPRPFSLRASRLGRSYHSSGSSEGADEATPDGYKSDTMFVFKAKPAPKRAPFLPKKSTKPLTQIADLSLQTETRSLQRQAFDIVIEKKAKQRADLQQRLGEQEEQARQAAIKKERQATIHKPAEMADFSRVFKPLPSSKPLTTPKPPVFATDLKRKHSILADQENAPSQSVKRLRKASL